MNHIHARTEHVKRGYKAIVEVCNNGTRMFKIEGRKLAKTEKTALRYAQQLGSFLEKDMQIHTYKQAGHAS